MEALQDLLKSALSAPIPNTLIVFGVVFLLIALAGRMSDNVQISPGKQALSFVVGMALIATGVAIHLSPQSPAGSATPTSVSSRATPTRIALLPTAAPGLLLPSVPTQLATAPPVPNSGCPDVVGKFFMPFASTWYGPYPLSGFALQWANAPVQGGFYFYMWDPNYSPYYGAVPYPIQLSTVIRNSWHRLNFSPFYFCIDGSSGQAFGQYSP